MPCVMVNCEGPRPRCWSAEANAEPVSGDCCMNCNVSLYSWMEESWLQSAGSGLAISQLRPPTVPPLKKYEPVKFCGEKLLIVTARVRTPNFQVCAPAVTVVLFCSS